MSFRNLPSHKASGTSIERLLHRIFVEDWSLKFLALAIALALWFIKSGRSYHPPKFVSSDSDITLMTNLFGTDGIRGEAGKPPLDVQTVQAVGRSLAKHLAQRKDGAPRLVIGRDTRESGPWIEEALVAGAREYGAGIHPAGIITTPGF